MAFVKEDQFTGAGVALPLIFYPFLDQNLNWLA